jgi:hypothetical protein
MYRVDIHLNVRHTAAMAMATEALTCLPPVVLSVNDNTSALKRRFFRLC